MTRSPSDHPDSRGRAQTQPKEKVKEKEGHRETVEAIVVAMILALLVRGFEAEAFVIPTGSMAPTLMGRHKEITCPQCGFSYAVNASEEDEGRGGRFRSDPKKHWIIAGTCVNCRYQANVSEAPTFNGDRILVMKFPYDAPFLPGSCPPQRWDVVVFRYPEDPEVSYIKRLVGLPGEEVRVYFGDIYIKPPGGKEFRLERKPLRHQDATQLMVYDDAHRPAALKDDAGWRRWAPKSPDAWKEEEKEPGTFVVTAPPGQEAELRYRHLVPDPEQWKAVLAGEALPRAPRATLITDFYSYNTNLTAGPFDLSRWFRSSDRDGDGGISKAEYSDSREVLSDRGDLEVGFDALDVDKDGVITARELKPREAELHIRYREADGGLIQPHWVGDLTVSGKLRVVEPGGVIRFELIEGGVANRCEIDLTTGTARLFHGDQVLGERATPVKGPGSYRFGFANVDDRLSLVIDGRPVFGDGLTYDERNGNGGHPAPTAADLSPVGINARGAKVAVSDLALKRDIYYTQYPGRTDYGSAWEDRFPRTAVEMFDLLADSSRFADLGNLTWQDYPLGADRFMMMGDNSPRSKDSRGWSHDDAQWDPSSRASWEVPRSLLTGKAFFIYWPHGKPFGPTVKVNDDFRLPFRPYFERMRWIR